MNYPLPGVSAYLALFTEVEGIILMLFALVVNGSGKYSLDHLIRGRGGDASY